MHGARRLVAVCTEGADCGRDALPQRVDAVSSQIDIRAI